MDVIDVIGVKFSSGTLSPSVSKKGWPGLGEQGNFAADAIQFVCNLRILNRKFLKFLAGL